MERSSIGRSWPPSAAFNSPLDDRRPRLANFAPHNGQGQGWKPLIARSRSISVLVSQSLWDALEMARGGQHGVPDRCETRSERRLRLHAAGLLRRFFHGARSSGLRRRSRDLSSADPRHAGTLQDDWRKDLSMPSRQLGRRRSSKSRVVAAAEAPEKSFESPLPRPNPAFGSKDVPFYYSSLWAGRNSSMTLSQLGCSREL